MLLQAERAEKGERGGKRTKLVGQEGIGVMKAMMAHCSSAVSSHFEGLGNFKAEIPLLLLHCPATPLPSPEDKDLGT